MSVKAAPDTPPVYLSAAQVLARYGGRSDSWLDRKLAKDPKFPKPIYFGRRLRLFRLDDLEAYERACAGGQDAA
ncbi:MAG TPA: hypothetical protein VE999_00970 [Gemmataceae bacterium]|jgi:predicted DNA-binding transcriptional regulator AlpA|nr:hypothetical protein [Gemmataceae bacterium]